jgi:predicted nucleic acid-binding Zn ribbon protein
MKTAGRAEPCGKEDGWLDERKTADPEWMEAVRKEFIDTVPSGLCPQCGSPVYQNPRGRHKRFCSEKCRFAWKNRHPNPANWKSTRIAVCPVCGKEFMARTSAQLYCSDECRMKGALLKRNAPKPKKTMDRLKEIALEATKNGMTYGEYVARMMK